MPRGEASSWHLARHRSLMARHPEIRRLFGPNPWTAAWIVGVVAADLAISIALSDAAWPRLIALAFVVGAPLAHASGVLIHECAHNLVFRAPGPNKVMSLVANLPLVLPGAIDFRDKHMLHHKHLGEGETHDFQTPTRAAVRWVGSSRARKAIWLAVGSLIFPKRPIDGLADRRRTLWLTANAALQLVAVVALLVLAGPRSLAFLGLSALFAFGPHPLAMRGFGEHVPLRPGQPTCSYYGLGNFVSFFVGYHVEHHDFPSVPWSRLPELRRIGGPDYDRLAFHQSWIAMFVSLLLEDRFAVADYVRSYEEAPSNRPTRSRIAARRPGRAGDGPVRRRPHQGF